ncbi:MAG TPA: Uma2 family endonuclease [Acidobacteriaceae bacterium]|nr:Uma2 family endonuclease [Acidobacteriaceae bacterium]
MASAPSMLSIDEYLRTSYHPDVDYVSGEIEERNLGEFEHARLQYILALMFGRHEREWNVIGVTEQRIYVARDRVRICDVCLLDRTSKRERVLTTPPLLCIEILSPEDRLPRVQVVFKDYLDMGVKNIWLLDPIRQIAHTFDAEGLHVVNDTRLTVPNTPICLDLAEAFAAID